MVKISDLGIELYADGADYKGIIELNQKSFIKGITTNPSLMKKAGIADYEGFAKEVLKVVTAKPISFEVFSDDLQEMKRQARKIQSWQKNVFVKIPVCNTKGESTAGIVQELSHEGIQLNVTALFTLEQIKDMIAALSPDTSSILSVFAGRTSETGVDPMPIIKTAKSLIATKPKIKLLWACVREVYNIIQAQESGCDIITVPHDILAKAELTLGKSLEDMTLEAVRAFDKDARSVGFKL
ncbi:MAG: transaldolase [Verrucomicrobia bacterium GWC2_42_7]|nr:MAG: transaldolase [Verrucomicrobia bacterium GWC2_42_7]